MHHHQRQRSSKSDRLPGGPSGTTSPPAPLTGAWLTHLQRVASGDTGAGRHHEGASQEARAVDHARAQRTAVDDALASPSRPLRLDLLHEMSHRFGGADFSHVRLHDGPVAQRAVDAVDARALTSGPHVVVGRKATTKDIAHELVHTMDQAAGAVPGTDNGAGLRVSDPDDAGERRAVTVAERVMRGPAPVRHAAEDHASGHDQDHGPVQTHAHGGAGAAVQRVTDDAPAQSGPAQSAPEQEVPAPEAGNSDKHGLQHIRRLMKSIPDHAILQKLKVGWFAPHTWWPDEWMVEGEPMLRRALDRRVKLGEPFTDQELADIKHLSEVNPKWLQRVGIGTYQEAEYYVGGPYDEWMRLPSGRRVLVATLAIQKRIPPLPETMTDPPIGPDYTLGRFMLTKSPNVAEDVKEEMKREMYEQIRQTAVDTLHPAGLPDKRRHPGAGQIPGKWMRKDADARALLTKVLLILRNGLKLYDAGRKVHVDDHQQDVVRALAHGGRVVIDIPALADGQSPYALTDFLGATQPVPGRPDTDGRDAEYQPGRSLYERDFATHRMEITEGEEGKPGKFQEQGEFPAAVKNFLSKAGSKPPTLLGMDIAGGGLGARDWNGDMILPNGSWGHILLVFQKPTATTKGSLLIGIETLAPGAKSPVGYEHKATSSEATANDESVLHGHKADKVGEGKLKDNPRLVELSDFAQKRHDGDWRAFLDELHREWVQKLSRTADGSMERDALYRELLGPRQM